MIDDEVRDGFPMKFFHNFNVKFFISQSFLIHYALLVQLQLFVLLLFHLKFEVFGVLW